MNARALWPHLRDEYSPAGLGMPDDTPSRPLPPSHPLSQVEITIIGDKGEFGPRKLDDRVRCCPALPRRLSWRLAALFPPSRRAAWLQGVHL